MNNTKPALDPALNNDMEHVIEPLASYLCATEDPEMALKLALVALYSDIHQTNITAIEYVARFLEPRLTISL